MSVINRIIAVLILICFFKTVTGQTIRRTDSYHFYIDLTKVTDDKLEIELKTPRSKTKKLTYCISRIVPGTYSDDNFGRYVSNFRAFTKDGKALEVIRTTVNTFEITNAKQLHSIKYLVDDTWDSPQIPGHFIFEPTGSDISKDSVFVINTHAFFGYFNGLKKLPYTLEFKKPAGFYGATSLKRVAGNSSSDHFYSPDYQFLVDGPILYARPDTTSLNVGGTRVQVALYSPNKKIRSTNISASIFASLQAQRAYLGGKLPVDHYTFLIVLDDQKRSGHVGALEHSYSSMFYRKEDELDQLLTGIKSSATHEFFHIVTPLSIHAEQIGDFDFMKPRMSEHLWLYEGLTEYASGHMQVKYGLMSLPDYLKILERKISDMKFRFSETLPMTDISKQVLGRYKTEYPNFYSKGALIWLCLDIRLRELSNGKYGTQNLIADLSHAYGRDRSFRDDEFFLKITSLTYPEIGSFLKTYVSGKTPLPIEEYLEKIGVRMMVNAQSSNKDGDQVRGVVSLKVLDIPGLSAAKLRSKWLAK